MEEGLDCLRESGLLALGVPKELGGGGATIRDAAMVQRELAHHCASTALATSMHQHVVAFTAWRFRRELPGAEATLRRVADEGIVLVSTGGADLTHPRGEATKVDGGYQVSGRKIFGSQSPAGTVMSTMFAYDDPEQGRRVLNMAVPIAAEGVTVLDDWDTMGMRGTGSNDDRDRRRVRARRAGARQPAPRRARPAVPGDPLPSPCRSSPASTSAWPRRRSTRPCEAAAPKADDPIVQRQVGLMATRLRVASWALDGALAEIGDDVTPSMENVAAVMAAKREIALGGIEVCDLAMELAGGAAFFKGSVIERCYRDIRAIKFHPLNPEATLLHAGRVALGQPADVI